MMIRSNFTFPKELFKDLKDYCKEEDLMMSELMRHLVRQELYLKRSQNSAGRLKSLLIFFEVLSEEPAFQKAIRGSTPGELEQLLKKIRKTLVKNI